MKLLKNFSLGLGVILLAGCTTQQVLKPVANPAQTWQSYAHKVYAYNNWQASGVMGIRNDTQAVSANFNWKQTGNQFVIQLSGPLNLGAEVLQGQPGQISLSDNKGQVVKADNAEDLMQQTLGWSMPVEGLVYWIKALPVSQNQYHSSLNSNGTLASLSQQGWAINYESYQVVNGLPMPHKIIMQQAAWRIVIVINNWQLS
ncbi:MAG: lolB2 [Gammaproteobacteria bacterium]|nr:lolB2 [Gammaproteobacteria bacterium]